MHNQSKDVQRGGLETDQNKSQPRLHAKPLTRENGGRVAVVLWDRCMFTNSSTSPLVSDSSKAQARKHGRIGEAPPPWNGSRLTSTAALPK